MGTDFSDSIALDEMAREIDSLRKALAVSDERVRGLTAAARTALDWLANEPGRVTIIEARKALSVFVGADHG